MLTFDNEILITKLEGNKLYVGMLETTHIQAAQSAEDVVKGIRILDVNITTLNCDDIEKIKAKANTEFTSEVYPLSESLADLDKILNGHLQLMITEHPMGQTLLNIAEGDVYSYLQNNGCNVLPCLSAHRTNFNQRRYR